MYQIIHGNCLNVLMGMRDQCIHCCVTSPPYWALRDYGVAGQVGQEDTPKEYVDTMVQIFREVRRVLRDDGTLWINLGDSYATNGRGWGKQHLDKLGRECGTGGGHKHATTQCGRAPVTPGIKRKDLCGIPWRVAFALQDDGWYLRRDIIWSKSNPMPESITDRCTTAHEYIFHMSKNINYYYDQDAIMEQCESGPSDRKKMIEGKDRIGGQHKVLDDHFNKASMHTNIGNKRGVGGPYFRNKRSVWTVATVPFSGAHFAVFPPKLIEPCILAGCPEGGIVLDPFSGAGTTGLVAVQHARRYIGIELNPEYAKLSKDRLYEANRQQIIELNDGDVNMSEDELHKTIMQQTLDFMEG